jgi:hypothetical protein
MLEWMTMNGAKRAYTTPAAGMHRRGLIASGASALLAGAALATTARAAAGPVDGLDAELLALCAAFHRQHAAVLAVAAGGADAAGDEVELAEALSDRWDLSDRIQDMPVATIAGHRAKASVAVVLLEENRGPDHNDSDAAFAFATLLEIARGTGA